VRPSLILKFTVSDIPVHGSNWFQILGTLALAQTWKTLTQQRKTGLVIHQKQAYI